MRYSYLHKTFFITRKLWLGNKFGLKNLGEVAQFLDLPDGKTVLMQRIKLLESALKYTKV